MKKETTPEILLNTLQLLFPNLKSITKDQWEDFRNSEFPFSEDIIYVDWGNVFEYPTSNWRDATIQDIQDPPLTARFKDHSPDKKSNWHFSTLGAVEIAPGSMKWYDIQGDYWKYCQVIDDGFPISTFPKNNYNTVLLFMGGKWVKGSNSPNDKIFYSDSETMSWDEQNQPTKWKPLPNDE